MTGEIERYAADAVILATGGYGTVYYLSTNAVNSNVTAAWRAHKRGALFANPCYTQIHPTCIPVSGDHQSKLTLMSESLRNDGRVWVPKKKGDTRSPEQIPEDERDYYLERKYPSFGNLVPRDVASRNAKQAADEGRGVGESGLAVYLDFKDAIAAARPRGDQGEVRQPVPDVQEDHRRGSVQGADADLPGHPLHDGRAVGRLQPDEHRARAARARRSQLLRPRREPARRQRADAGTGRRLLRHSLHHRRLPREQPRCRRSPPSTTRSRTRPHNAQAQINKLLAVKGNRGIRDIHRELGRIMWDDVGMARTEASLKRALQAIPKLREEFWHNVSVPGTAGQPQSEPRVRGPRRRLPRVRRAAGARRARAARIVRRPLPRGKPDAGRRSAARRRALLVRGRVGIQGRRRQRRSSTRSRSSSTKCIPRSGVTSSG